MRYVIYGIYTLLIIGINVAVFPAFSLRVAIPLLVLISCTVIAVSVEDVSPPLFMAMLGGFFWELYTGLFPGSVQIGYALAVWIVFMLSRRVLFVQDRIKYLPLFLLISQAIALIVAVFLNWYGAKMHGFVEPSVYSHLISQAAPTFVYNLILLYPVYFIVSQVEHLTDFFQRKRRSI